MNLADDMKPEDRKLLDWMRRTIRQGIVDGLMTRNDTQCFTTLDYITQYESGTFSSEVTPITDDLARSHLRWLKTVKEVKPDVWTWV